MDLNSIIFNVYICAVIVFQYTAHSQKDDNNMAKLLRNNKFWIALILVISVTVAIISLHMSQNTKLLDKAAYKEFKEAVDEVADSEAGAFESQEALRTFIKSWFDNYGLKYEEDEYGNIIFDKEPVKRKKNVTPTLVCVSMNYETACDNSQLLASAAAIALTGIESGRQTVIFVDDEQNLGKGYKGLTDKYVTPRTKVIYMDKGSSLYLSTASFEKVFSHFSLEAEREENVCDTAVKVTIKGVPSAVVTTNVNKQPDPISAFSGMLSRLKSKSAIYRVADLKVESNGDMYPVALEATITLNSYAAGSFTSYLDKRIKAWDKAYGKDNEDLVFSYEVVDKPESIPETTYTAETTDKLAGILYTVKSGTYKYADNDVIPENKKAGDVNGINALLGIEAGDDNISIRVMSQGAGDMYTNRILYDNKAAAELYGCEYKTDSKTDAFENDKDSLSLTFKKTYDKVNDTTSAGTELSLDTDNFFTPCSYLQAISSDADIIHLRMDGPNASKIANTVLCYIKTKGNISFF